MSGKAVGVFNVARGVFDHPAFASEPFTEREAWLWLCGEAAWKATQVRTTVGAVALERGQLAHSIRFMAERWQWSKSRVERYIARLRDLEMVATTAGQKRDTSGAKIGTLSGTPVSVLTICNYEAYQRRPKDSGTASGTEAGQGRSQKRDREEEVIPSTNVDGAAEAGAPVDMRKMLFGDGLASLRRQTGLNDNRARQLLGKWCKSAGDDVAKVLTKIRQAEADQVADAVAWITAALRSDAEYSRVWARG